jgi:hypothetical protein
MLDLPALAAGFLPPPPAARTAAACKPAQDASCREGYCPTGPFRNNARGRSRTRAFAKENHMPGPASHSYQGPPENGPYVLSWCYDDSPIAPSDVRFRTDRVANQSLFRNLIKTRER